jgi:hypothetical protein
MNETLLPSAEIALTAGFAGCEARPLRCYFERNSRKCGAKDYLNFRLNLLELIKRAVP